jgi:hypothetical protein
MVDPQRLRDEFAMAALPAIIAGNLSERPEMNAALAYLYANAMTKARSVKLSDFRTGEGPSQ